MVFSSITFIYYFLPILLLVYFLVPSKFKNLILLIFSLIFYFYGEGSYIWVLLLSIIINYIGGLLIGKSDNKRIKKLYLILTIIFDVLLLFYFKYVDFFIININNFLGSNLELMRSVMPIGISFFTFQTMSYVIDVYIGRVQCNKNLLDFATYVALFPQLVAGPIVRYADIDKELKERGYSFDNFSNGIERFIIGLGKKVLLANVLGEACSLFGSVSEVTVVSSWMKTVFYTLQIYFDFSGYSDMAIGLGLMFGFKFLENFNYPYIARSITDFWRRWHISLSSWFRDYIYIPLGGNRVSKVKWIRNILVVWFLTGFWHGADWNFVIWGLYFAIILLIEKIFFNKFLEKHKIFGHIYTLFLVIISFVIFNNDISIAIEEIKNMFFINELGFINKEAIYYFRSYLIIFIISIVAATPVIRYLYEKINLKKKEEVFGWLKIGYLVIVLILCTAYLIDASFNPFLYFRF